MHTAMYIVLLSIVLYRYTWYQFTSLYREAKH